MRARILSCAAIVFMGVAVLKSQRTYNGDAQLPSRIEFLREPKLYVSPGRVRFDRPALRRISAPAMGPWAPLPGLEAARPALQLSSPQSLAAAPAQVTGAPLPGMLLADGVPKYFDILFGLVFVSVLAFTARNIFDTTFAENENEFVPPNPMNAFSKLPFIGDAFGTQEYDDPEAAAEDLRQRLKVAIETRDIEATYRLEKELKQLLNTTGVRYMIDQKPTSFAEQEEQMPEKW